MKSKLLLIIMFGFLRGFSQEIAVFNKVDSTYILNASTAAKLTFLAEKGLYVDTLINLNNQLYTILQEQNEELSKAYTDFENYKIDSEGYNHSIILNKQEKLEYYEKMYKKNRKWKWLWTLASVVLAGIITLN